jgi:HK97 family phage major capsid protein
MQNQSRSATDTRHNARSWYSFQNSAAGVEIYLYGEIDPQFGITARDFIGELQRLGPKEPFTLRINSPGGDVTEGFAVFNALARHQGKITVAIDGLAGSIASVIAMVGDPVTIASNAYLMIHEAWGAGIGVSEDMRSVADTLDKMTATIIDAYQKKTNLPREQIAELLAAETWLNATEAKQLGFVDEVTDALRMAASVRDFNLKKFRNAPQQFIQQPKNHNMQTAPTQTEIEAAADELYKAKLNRDKEIDDIAESVRKRDGKDFRALAAEFKQAGKTPDQFCRAITTSDEYRNIQVIGSGDEHNPTLDGRTIGAIVTRNPEFQALVRNGFSGKYRVGIPIEGHDRFRAALTSGSLGGVEIRPEIVLLGQQRLTIADLIPQDGTTAPLIRYLQENGYTPAADTVGEGETKPEFVPDLTKVDAAVKKIAVFAKVGEETLADYTQTGAYLNQRLPFQVMQKEEQQLLYGNGAGNNLAGIFNVAGLQTHAKGADTRPDALFKALTLIRTQSHQEPSGYVIHPNDWESLRLSKDANNQYYGGGPFTGAYGQQVTNIDFLWQKPVVVTTAITQGTALAGAFSIAAFIFRRTGLMLEMTNSDQDDFILNLVTMRAEQREALAVYFGNAFCQITGL